MKTSHDYTIRTIARSTPTQFVVSYKDEPIATVDDITMAHTIVRDHQMAQS